MRMSDRHAWIAAGQLFCRVDSDVFAADICQRKGSRLNPSLSVLLPVQNGQATLQADVQRVLEVLPELTSQFEVLIVDDGSHDATYEVAHEFARDYPQVAVWRHADSIGWSATVARHASKARGDFLMIHSGGRVEPADIAGLWRLRQGIAAAALAKAKAAQAGKALRIDAKTDPGIEPTNANAPAGEISSRGLGVHARAPRSNLLLVHRQQLGQLEQSLASINRGWPAAARRHGPQPVKSPTFLSRVKRFALGE